MKYTVLFLFIILGACNYNHVRGEAPNPPGADLKNLSLEASMDYSSVQLTVLGPECLRCHSAAGGNQGGFSMETYAQVRASMNRIYFRAIEKKDMPPTAMAASQYDLLKAWLEAGAPEKNTGQKAGPPIKGAVGWDVIKNRVLKSSCLDCHAGVHAEADLDLSSAEVVRANIKNIFDAAIVNQTMPLPPYPTLSQEEKQALMKWISAGMPQ